MRRKEKRKKYYRKVSRVLKKRRRIKNEINYFIEGEITEVKEHLLHLCKQYAMMGQKRLLINYNQGLLTQDLLLALSRHIILYKVLYNPLVSKKSKQHLNFQDTNWAMSGLLS